MFNISSEQTVSMDKDLKQNCDRNQIKNIPKCILPNDIP